MIHLIPAKYAATNQLLSSRPNEDFRMAVSYTPWLRALVSDIWLGSVYASKIVTSNSVVSGSFRYLSLGNIVFTNIQGDVVGDYKPVEWTADIAWSQKLSEHWYTAVAFRYIHSNLTSGQKVAGTTTKPGNSVAADLATYYERKLDDVNTIRFGANISNIGSKISYSDDNSQRDFIPTVLRLGSSFKMAPDENNKFTIGLELTKLLVPTPPLYLIDSTGQVVYDVYNNPIISKGKSPDVSVLRGMAQSFYDAPDGLREELREITFGLGAEYEIFKLLAFRAGYFGEAETKGGRGFFTLGLGLKYRSLEGNVTRWYSTDRLSPLQRTWHFSLGFNLARI